MRSLKVVLVLVVGVWCLFSITNATNVAADNDHGNRIALLDDCDPRVGAGWNTATDSTQCLRKEGSVSRAEFTAFLSSPLSTAVIGHPSWTIAPTYLKPELGDKLKVRNEGGRGHTFTEVANYGGGFIPNPQLNMGLTPAPECLAAGANPADNIIPPGGRMDIKGLSLGNHKFQCCIHPWMRNLVKVEPEENDHDK